MFFHLKTIHCKVNFNCKEIQLLSHQNYTTT